jgi:hypothetical protein
MKNNTLTIFLKGELGDKNNNLQLFMSSKIEDLKMLFWEAKETEFKDLNLFLQGYSKNWIMIETWNDNEDLFIKFCEWCSNKLQLKLEFNENS